MSHQLVKCPDGSYALFSSGVDAWVWHGSREEFIERHVSQAAADARVKAEHLADMVDEDPRKAYFQFAMTFAEANSDSIAHGGPDLTREEHAL